MSLLNLWNGGGTNCAIDASGATLTGNAQLHFGTLTTCNVGLQNLNGFDLASILAAAQKSGLLDKTVSANGATNYSGAAMNSASTSDKTVAGHTFMLMNL